MTRLVVFNGVQFDADNLPANVDADDCTPLDEWFADNAVKADKPGDPKPAPKAQAEPKPKTVAKRRGKS